MPDFFASITEADPALVERWTYLLEVRAADPEQRAMLLNYLADLPFPDAAEVLEIGCGTGAVTRVLAQWPGVAQVLGIDPSPRFIEAAGQLGAEIANLSFAVGDGRALELPDANVDVVVIHTTLCHIPAPEAVVAEAFRVLRPGGYLAIFDGDYAATSYALGDYDPLQNFVDAVYSTVLNDRWLVRRLSPMVQAAGFRITRKLRLHAHVETEDAAYSLGVIEQGIDAMARWGRIGTDTAEAMKREAHRRVGAGAFFASRAYGSVIAQKPA